LAAEPDRLDTVDSLRGIAVFAVVWFHLTNGNRLLPPSWLRTSGQLGWLGVDIFFVISGFVIPHALYRADYRLKDCGRFLLRRAARLEPPYLVSIVLLVGLAFISARLPGFRGQPPSYSVPQLLSHIPYLTALFGFTWINIVYWSLALELQYYLLMGLWFPLIAHSRIGIRMLTILLFEILAFLVPNELIVLRWMPLFTLGILTFFLRHGMLGVRWYVASIIAATACVVAIFGADVAVVASATSLLIAFVNINAAPLLFLGSISYSLYLIHVPIGGRLINAMVRFPLGPMLTASITVAVLGVSILAAQLFYLAVEKPAKLFAHHIKFARRSQNPLSR
jgi:peptidoglycan/LPS O-acetylase OafA/YrhL